MRISSVNRIFSSASKRVLPTGEPKVQKVLPKAINQGDVTHASRKQSLNSCGSFSDACGAAFDFCGATM